MTSLYRELYGPQDTSVLTQQETHRSELLYKKVINEDTTLKLTQTMSNIFWNFRDDDHTSVRLHPRVLNVLHAMGFYRVARCGAMFVDSHLITALVERWRTETHTFHFPIGEATVTLQDVAIIWGLYIDGQPLTIDEHNKPPEMWAWYCNEFLGFIPAADDFKSKTRLKMSAIKEYFLGVEITDYTDQTIVNQYARGCVLLMIGSFMMPDSSRSHVSLLYLLAIADVEDAGSYSWGSAVLAYLYRELCTASDGPRGTIGGPVSLLQIWAWSRISIIRSLNLAPMLVQGPLHGAGGHELGLPPYGSRWVTHHTHTHSTRHSVHIYRDIFDRMDDDEFSWDVYDMTLPEIKSLDDRCLTQNWMSECPLINNCIVEIHHPSRVLRQFDRRQNIPTGVDGNHAYTHHISFQGRDGCNWTYYHRDWIQHWNNKQPLADTVLIHGNSRFIGPYMKWYRKITRLLISPSHYKSAIGYESFDLAARNQVFQMMDRLSVAVEVATYEELRDTCSYVIREINHLLGRTPLIGDDHQDTMLPCTVGAGIMGPSTAGPYTSGSSTTGPIRSGEIYSSIDLKPTFG